MTILFNNHEGDQHSWQTELAKHLPDMPIHIYPDIPDPEAIKYAIVWKHPRGDLARYPNLKAILSLGAGMEHLLNDPDLPDLPLVSLSDPYMSEDMANYALYWVMHYHRHYGQYQQQQVDKQWQSLQNKATREFKVVLMGLGRIGQKVVQTIDAAGFDCSGWDFNAKSAGNVPTFSGKAALPELLADVDVVISCLALDQRSRQLINEEFLAAMPKGSCVINISRGAVVDESALLTALNSGQIRGAALDVLAVEPLPEEHPFWHHPHVAITPHMAGPTPVATASQLIAENIHRLERGEEPDLLFDRNRGKQ